MRTKIILTAMAFTSGAAIAIAQTNHSGHGEGMDHSAHGQDQTVTAGILSEPGQGAFAALSEVVHVLEADPDTDWATVDLAGCARIWSIWTGWSRMRWSRKLTSRTG